MSFLRPIQLTAPKNLLTDVENRRVFSLNNCELNVFETYRTSEAVQLTFNDLVITSMIRGKKVMHLPGIEQFDYFPGETALAPAGTKMVIDFPEAMEHNPTQCIALTLDADNVTNTLNYMREYFPRTHAADTWNLNFNVAHLKNSPALADVINKLVTICTDRAVTKDILADLTMKELIVRLVQLQNLEQLQLPLNRKQSAGPFHELTQYIQAHLFDRLEISNLARVACMSRTQLFRNFKREFGISPAQYITRERIKKAKVLLGKTSKSIQQVSMETGFEDVNNFIKIFKKAEGATPGSYRVKLLSDG